MVVIEHSIFGKFCSFEALLEYYKPVNVDNDLLDDDDMFGIISYDSISISIYNNINIRLDIEIYLKQHRIYEVIARSYSFLCDEFNELSKKIGISQRFDYAPGGAYTAFTVVENVQIKPYELIKLLIDFCNDYNQPLQSMRYLTWKRSN